MQPAGDLTNGSDNKRDQKLTQKSINKFFKSSNAEATPSELKGEENQINLNNHLKIWHWNVNGIRAVINSKKFEEFVT